MFSLGKKVPPVCLNVVSELSHFEMLQYDPVKGAFMVLDSEEFMFDPTTREMLEDEERLQLVLKRLYERNKIPLGTPTTLVLPSYFTRHYVIPEESVVDDLESILVAEAERFYVFKKADPHVGYAKIKENQVLYTAYPKSSFEKLKETINGMGIPLVSIDCNYTAAIRGLVAMGVVQQEIANQVKWGLVMITDQMVFMAILEGYTIEKIVESPLSSAGVEISSLMGEIRDDFQQFCGFEILNRLVVVNNSARIYSTQLVEMLGFQGQTDVYDQNERTLISRKAPDAPYPCTLEAVGGVLVTKITEIPPMEMGEGFQAVALSEESQLVNIIAGVLILIAALIYGAEFGAGKTLEHMGAQETEKNQLITNQINASVNAMSELPEVKKMMFIKYSIKHNYRFSNFLFKTLENLPEDTWLDTMKVDSAPNFNALVVSLEGGTKSSDLLNDYINKLNSELGDQKLLPDITPDQHEDERYFKFSLKNQAPTAAPH